MKSITAVGYLTKDCEVVESEKSSFVKFSIAVDDGYGENKGTIFLAHVTLEQTFRLICSRVNLLQ